MKNLLKRILNLDVESTLFSCLIVFCGMFLYRCFNSIYIISDTIEHMQASLAVYQGMVPYRDFFEHHNPLLWYLFAPISNLFYGNANIIKIYRIIGVCIYFLCIYVFYRINAKYIYKDKKISLFSVLFLISVPALWDDANLRPDSFMLLFFLIGCKMYFDYLKQNKTRYLVFSYLSMSISFLFLQKILFCLLSFGIINLYDLLKKHIKLPDFIIACAIGGLPIALFVSVLLYMGIFADYIYYNYTFNTLMVKYYDGHLLAPYLLSVSAIITFLIIIRTYKYSPQTALFALCFILSALSLIYFSPLTPYYLTYFLMASSLLAPVLYKYRTKGSTCLISALFIISILFSVPKTEEKANYISLEKTSKCFIDENLSNDVLDFSNATFNLFKPIQNYYWFGWPLVHVDLWNNKNRNFDINEYIKQTNHKYLIIPEHYGTLLPNDMINIHAKWFRDMNFNLMMSRPKDIPLDEFIAKRTHHIQYDIWGIDKEYIAKNYTKGTICSMEVYIKNDEGEEQ